MNNLSSENSSIQEHCNNLLNTNHRLNDENKILKRAVGIQENKQREMQEVMNQAADYITTLERTNSILRLQVESCNYPEPYLPDLPPDIY